MKRITSLLLFLILICSACQKEINNYLGEYSFKTSGSVIINESGTITTHQLSDKIGQMVIMKNEEGNPNDLIITMNEMNGVVYTMNGKIENDSIFVTPHPHSLKIVSGDNTRLFTITSSGKGLLIDNSIILHESYTGFEENTNETCTLSGDEIITVAKRN